MATVLGKLAIFSDSRLVSQNNHLIGIWMPVSIIEQRGCGGSKVKRPLILQIYPGMNGQPQGGDVFIFSFLQPSTGGQDQDIFLNKGTLV